MSAAGKSATAKGGASELEEARLDAMLSLHGIVASEFRPLDFQATLDVEGRIAETPATATAKGMFFESLARGGRKWGVPCESKYVAFRDYPLRDFMRLLVAYGRARYPGLPSREALRRVGWEAFPALMSSVAGRVLYTFAGDVRGALRLAPEAYKQSLKPSAVSSRLSEPGQVVLELREVWNFPECYHVGVIEGGCRAFGAEPRIRARVVSASSVELLIRW